MNSDKRISNLHSVTFAGLQTLLNEMTSELAILKVTDLHIWSVKMYADPASWLFVPDSRFLRLTCRGYTSTTKQSKAKIRLRIFYTNIKPKLLLYNISEQSKHNKPILTEWEGRTGKHLTKVRQRDCANDLQSNIPACLNRVRFYFTISTCFSIRNLLTYLYSESLDFSKSQFFKPGA